MNDKLANIARTTLKEDVKKCTESQQLLFKKLYSHDITLPLDTIIDNLPVDKLDHAMFQVLNTLEKTPMKKKSIPIYDKNHPMSLLMTAWAISKAAHNHEFVSVIHDVDDEGLRFTIRSKNFIENDNHTNEKLEYTVFETNGALEIICNNTGDIVKYDIMGFLYYTNCKVPKEYLNLNQ